MPLKLLKLNSQRAKLPAPNKCYPPKLRKGAVSALLTGAADAGMLPSLMLTLISYKISNGTGRKRFPQLTWFGPFIRPIRIFSGSSFSG
jgi:hypothetical protein